MFNKCLPNIGESFKIFQIVAEILPPTSVAFYRILLTSNVECGALQNRLTLVDLEKLLKHTPFLTSIGVDTEEIAPSEIGTLGGRAPSRPRSAPSCGHGSRERTTALFFFTREPDDDSKFGV